MEVIAKPSVCIGLDVRIMVVPLGHNVDEKPLQVPMSFSSTVTAIASSEDKGLMNFSLA